MPFLAQTFAAVFGMLTRLVIDGDERIYVWICLEDDMAAAAAVAAVGTAKGDTFLAPETGASVAAAAGEDIGSGRLNKFEAFQIAGASSSTRTRLPSFSNLTTPDFRAKSVSSRPRLTFTPGCIRVPRWRIMMLPAVTTWPSNRLIPSRLPWLSRPFFALPELLLPPVCGS